MNISYELSKIKDAFVRVRNDMNFLSKNLMSHYEEHKKNHQSISQELSSLSDEVKNYINEHKNMSLNISSDDKKDFASKKSLLDLKDAIKDLKKELSHTQKEHLQLIDLVEKVDRSKVDNNDFKDLQDKFRSSELELHLLKEKLSKKDIEVETLKDVNNKMFSIIDELTKTEMDLLEATK